MRYRRWRSVVGPSGSFAPGLRHERIHCDSNAQHDRRFLYCMGNCVSFYGQEGFLAHDPAYCQEWLDA